MLQRISNSIRMCDRTDYSSCSSDEDIARTKVVADRSCSLVPLNFALYEVCGDMKQTELGVQLIQFNTGLLSVVPDEQNPDNFKIFYDGHKFRLFRKAFPAFVKRSKYFAREKHIKIKDRCQSKLLWEVFWNISERVMEVASKEDKFCRFIEWCRIWVNFCDKRLASKHIYYFEEASVAIDRVIMIKESEHSKEFRLSAEIIDPHVLWPSSVSFFRHKEKIEEGDKSEVILLN